MLPTKKGAYKTTKKTPILRNYWRKMVLECKFTSYIPTIFCRYFNSNQTSSKNQSHQSQVWNLSLSPEAVHIPLKPLYDLLVIISIIPWGVSQSHIASDVFHPTSAHLGATYPPTRYRGLIAGLIKGNQWLFISPDHKALFHLFLGGYIRGGWLTSH